MSRSWIKKSGKRNNFVFVLLLLKNVNPKIKIFMAFKANAAFGIAFCLRKNYCKNWKQV